jgi:methyl-accepting chemotaxis protein
MGIVSLGRSLFLKQMLLGVLILGLGGYFCVALYDLEILVRDASPADPHVAVLLSAFQATELHAVIATGLALAVAAVASAGIIRRTVSAPLETLAQAADQLAAGDRSVTVPEDARADEIGQIARALRTMRDSTAVRSASASDASDERIRLLSERIERFSQNLASHVRRLGVMTKRLAEAAQQMTDAAKHANDGSNQATAASSNAAGDVSSVATASEQLLDSIEEISRQVVQSTNVVRAAVERAVETNAGMGRLSTAAQKVGDVVSLISRIAAQTNLLALNATIEAARAGEAGRGFAVVAQEVKTLATQTAKATQDISGQIAEMQEATNLSVEAIDKIQTKIAEVEHISTIIASAVHEQGAATQEIARNVRSAAAGTSTISNQIENVVRSVGETSASAESVSALARELDEIAIGMTDMVSAFGQSLRAA